MNGYAYVWEYQVPHSSVERFESLYGPKGEWVQLFQRAEGYVCTELLRDRESTGRYLSIDHWQSKEAYDSFRTRFAHEYAAIDQLGDGLTAGERFLGSFAPIGHAIEESKRA